MSAPQSYEWMPAWLRKFLNLDGEMPTYRSSSSAADAPTTGSAASYSSPQQNASAPSSFAPAQPSWQPKRMDEGQSLDFYKPARATEQRPPDEAASQQNEPEPVRFVGPTSGAEPPSRLDANGNVVPVEGYVQPISYMLRGFVRGALPPQGLEQFTREVRATATDVYNFYGYWTRFQTDDFVRFGRGVITSIVESLPSPDALTAPHGGRVIRRAIKVNAPGGNGEKKEKEAEEE